MPTKKPQPPAATRDAPDPAPAREMAPAVPLIVNPARGTVRGVDLHGSGPDGALTAEETAARLSLMQYRTGLRIGLFRPVPSPAQKDGDT